MSNAAIPRAVLDTNVIFSRVLHELFGRLAREARLFDLIWSDELLDEAKRTLIDKKPTTEPIAERWVGYLREGFPSGRVAIRSLTDDIDLGVLTGDPGDGHVCALALAGNAQYLITFDESFRREALLAHGIAVVTPDEILTPTLDEQPEMIRSILERQVTGWGDRPVAQLLDALERAGLTDFVREARATLNG